MPETTACIRGEVATDGTYVAQILFPFDEFGKKARRALPHNRTSAGIIEEPEDTFNGHGRLRSDLPLLRPPVPVLPRGRFKVLQQYEGIVVSIEKETFWARLIDRTRPGEPDEEGELPLEEVSPGDRRLVREGAVFYWHIGYHDSAGGQRTRQSVIRFRRLPAVLEEDLDVARQEAKRLMELFGRDRGNERLGEE